MTEIKTNRNHKDSVFTLLFSEPPAALELYNAVTGQNYPPDTKIEIVTLSNALFKGQLNDALEVAREEAREDGRKEGHEELFTLWERGVPIAEAKKKMGLS